MTIEFRRNVMNKGSYVLGFGLLGALDGIVFHQLLQWHSLYMHTDLHGQIISDGLFHTLTVVALVIGAILLWLAGHPSNIKMGKRLLLGGVLIGGGAFNLLEGIINHHILQIHHVKPGDPNEFLYDLAFLLLGAILIVIGMMIRREITGREEVEINPIREKAK